MGDFEASWDALAATLISRNRGNFMFGLLAVCLLEVTCRLCKGDASGEALSAFSEILEARDRRYFTALPGTCWAPNKRTREAFDLPSRGASNSTVIAAIFNLIRNGQAHQYQQMTAELADGKRFAISLTGAESGYALDSTFKQDRPVRHLQVKRDPDGDLLMTVMPNVLFLDIRHAIEASGLLRRGLSFRHLVEQRKATFNFTSAEAEALFDSCGHAAG